MGKVSRSRKNIVQRMSLLMGRSKSSNIKSYYESRSRSRHVPRDVKEGHFAVMAVDTDEPKRFVVPLTYLAHPRFQKLLEQAAEEFGFNREGALAIPCTPNEIETILADSHSRLDDHVINTSNNSWASSNSMLQIH